MTTSRSISNAATSGCSTPSRWSTHGTLAALSGVVTGEAQSETYGAQLPFAQFEGVDALGNPRRIEWSDIRYLIVLFGSGNASGGKDFSVTSTHAVDAPDE